MAAGGVTILGLGPGDPKALTREAWELLSSGPEVYLRTLDHPVIEHLPAGLVLHSFDELYQTLNDYDRIYPAIVDAIMALAQRPQGVIYAVPGDPTVGEATVLQLRARATASQLPLRLIHGISFIEPCLALIGQDALDGLALADALALAAGHHPAFSPDQPALIAQLHDRAMAADVKLTLMNQYPPEHRVMLLDAAATPNPRRQLLPLHELDHQSGFTSLTTLFVPPLAQAGSFEALQEIVAHLRAPEGCPWDRAQTNQSLRPHLLEEAYEALSALDAEDMHALKEELGDLLLQIVLQAQIATEQADFTMAEVIAGINAKLVRRHPHVFGDLQLAEVEQVLQNWEHLKSEERGEGAAAGGLLAGVPEMLPALAQAAELQSRASRVGFEWDSIGGVLDKVAEEIQEVQRAPDTERRARELGDLIFALVNYARWLEIDPEAELRRANRRFRDRFARVVELARGAGLELDQMDAGQLDRLWEQAKADDR